MGSAVARFMLGSLAAIAVVVIGGLFFVLRSVATEEAERDIRERVVIEVARRDGAHRRRPER